MNNGQNNTIKPTKKEKFIEGLEIVLKELYVNDSLWNPNEEEANDVDHWEDEL